MNSPDRSISDRPKRFESWFIAAACLGVLAMLPVFFRGFPVGADFDNHFRFALPFYEEIERGNYFPGWLAESNFGFGDPRFRFYPPFLYYLLCLFRFLTGEWYYAAIIVFTLFSAAGTAGVYLWARRSMSGPLAFFAAALFAAAPYHLTQFYQASLLAEFVAAALLPYAFLFVEKLTTGAGDGLSTRLFNAAALAAVYSLIVSTHLPTTVIGSCGLGVFALLTTDRKNDKKALLFCAAALALALVSCSWFWAKMVGELGFIQAGEKVSSAHYDYRNNFIFSPFSPSNLNTWYGSFVALLTIVLFAPSVIIWRRIFRKKSSAVPGNELSRGFDDKVNRRLAAAFVLTLFSLFMTTDFSRPVWAVVPKLKDVQFPYRWLVIASIMICPLTAFSLPVWLEKFKRKDLRAVHLLLPAAFVAALAATTYDLVFNSKHISRAEFSRRIEAVRGARSFNDWLPRGAKEIKDLQPLDGQVDAGSRPVSIAEWGSHKRVFTIDAGTEPTARLRSYYYPLWRASIVKDEQRIPIATERAADGTLLVALPNEKAKVEVLFVEPRRTQFSLLASALGWLLILLLLVGGRLKPRAAAIK
ncbi:MAG TPA: 6-pyruvoyl-tetrahydropterin synthase-related protein [Pyrinomonadaceae bacterium]|jgi:4-amino-4-deoxy-L-arabinose transferase-like glycosyltransferase